MNPHITVENPCTRHAVAIINHIGKDVQQVNWIFMKAANSMEFPNLVHFIKSKTAEMF